ncbi:MAG: 23S rRNA (uracil(1939)-C(5))-methyltransferase RlmD [Oscillospiraceae bacterium]|nr:23S rRNA (uracil(1939)-C(5))-methyltransferase RlmD [Oscillospiraceae bacterium]
MLKKNDEIIVSVDGMTSEGNGVGRFEGMAVFIPFSAVGDVLKVHITKVQRTFAYGIIKEIITPSPDRIEPDCPVFGKCGGCSFRHISYDAELLIKENIVRDAFKRIGKIDVPFEDILGCEERNFYRNKAQYPVAEIDGKAVCGFYSKRSHRVIPFVSCKLQPPVFEEILNFILYYVNQNKIPAYDESAGKGILRHIYIRQGYYSKEIMVCFVVFKDIKTRLLPLAEMICEKFSDVKSVVMNVNPMNTNVILGNKTEILLGSEEISDLMCGNRIKLSLQSFYQINTAQAEKLYGIVRDYAELSGKETVMDLYCGAGTIGLSLAKDAVQIIGVEVIPEAIENAKENASENMISNAPDVIIVDPPRKGCEKETLDAILKMDPKKIIMVSCNSATAARDCAYICESGYIPIKGRAVDLFPATMHVECLVLMSRVKD